MPAAPSVNPLAPRPGHFPAKAKSVIWLFMNGGPSQVDTWDYKPELAKRDGQELKGFDKNTGFFTDQVGPLMKSPFRVRSSTASRAPGSRKSFPNMAQHVDEMAFLHSCWTDSNNHSPALFKINTGMTPHGLSLRRLVGDLRPGQREPESAGFVVMYDTLGRGLPKGYAQNWGAGFLPEHLPGHGAQAAGRADRQPRSPRRHDRRASSAASSICSRGSTAATSSSIPDEAELAARIETLRAGLSHADGRPRGARPRPRNAGRSQQLYGLDNPKCTHFAKQCLIARRLVERGVRFVQIYTGGMENERSWDGHIEHRRQPPRVRRRDRHADRRPA